MQKERSLLRISLAVSALTLVFMSAGHTQTKSAENYLPLATGNTWKLAHRENGATVVVTGVITSSLNSGDVTEATLEWSRSDTLVETETYRATATEVDRTAAGINGADRINPPMPILKYPLTAGAKWTWKGTIGMRGKNYEANSASTVSGPTRVLTEAGTFQAMRVHSEVKIAMGKSKYDVLSDYYYAPGVGIVEVDAFQTVGKLTSYKVK